MIRPLLAIVFALVLGASSLAAPTDPTPDPHARVQGMTVSCQTWGWEWGSDEMVRSMEILRDLGVNWIAIHPYAGIRADGTVSIPDRWYADANWIKRPIEEAHRLGLKILIKPHIAYWGSPFSWRGEIEFDTDEEWERFFRTYRAWIVQVAEASVAADGFVVGTELDRTVRFEDRWRGIIADIRKTIDLPLTYSANWDSYQRVRFWDALDVIGVQCYFPLVAHEHLPEPNELEAGWRQVIRDLDDFARPLGKKILLAELGYNRSSLAAARPWEYRSGGPDAEETQRRCLDSALRALRETDLLVGAFLWKWFPGESSRGNFIKSTPVMREVIRDHWK